MLTDCARYSYLVRHNLAVCVGFAEDAKLAAILQLKDQVALLRFWTATSRAHVASASSAKLFVCLVFSSVCRPQLRLSTPYHGTVRQSYRRSDKITKKTIFAECKMEPA